jgi:hypothetical protein
MDKIERMDLVRRGITVLRSQYNQRKSCWMIAKATLNGGWTHFSTSWYLTRQDTDKKIDFIVSQNPDKIKKD